MRRGNINIFVQSKLFALNFVSKYGTDVILLVRLEISILYSPLMLLFQELGFWNILLNGDYG